MSGNDQIYNLKGSADFEHFEESGSIEKTFTCGRVLNIVEIQIMRSLTIYQECRPLDIL